MLCKLLRRLAWLLVKVLIKLEYMLAGLLIFALIGCMGLQRCGLKPMLVIFWRNISVRRSPASSRVQGTFIDRLDNFFCLHYCHHSSSIGEQAQLLGPGFWPFVLSGLRRGLYLVGSQTLAQPRIIPEANN